MKFASSKRPSTSACFHPLKLHTAEHLSAVCIEALVTEVHRVRIEAIWTKNLLDCQPMTVAAQAHDVGFLEC